MAKLPSTIGDLILALVVAWLLIGTQYVRPLFYQETCGIVEKTQFSELLFEVMLGFLLIAGAIHIDLRKLLKEKKIHPYFCQHRDTNKYYLIWAYFLLFISLDWP